MPFNKNELKNQAIDIACNQGLPALIGDLEKMANKAGKGENLNHPMWKALKQAAQSNDPQTLIDQATTSLKNSGQAEEILKTIT